VHDDLVHRVFTAPAPDVVWQTDITQAIEGKLYCCTVKDVFSNRIAGYALDDRMTVSLAVSALHSAIARRQWHHGNHVPPRVPMANACAERWVRTLCHEVLDRTIFWNEPRYARTSAMVTPSGISPVRVRAVRASRHSSNVSTRFVCVSLDYGVRAPETAVRVGTFRAWDGSAVLEWSRGSWLPERPPSPLVPFPASGQKA
jgi:transposase InsO family protein